MTVPILAIDPGPTKSAFLILRGGKVDRFGIEQNPVLVDALRRHPDWVHAVDLLAIEKIEGFGMVVGQETFDTALWSGRFIEALHPCPAVRISRREVKVQLCRDSKARDSNIRQALIDRLGPVGLKASPGPLYGISGDSWSALAIAIVTSDLIDQGRLPKWEV